MSILSNQNISNTQEQPSVCKDPVLGGVLKSLLDAQTGLQRVHVDKVIQNEKLNKMEQDVKAKDEQINHLETRLKASQWDKRQLGLYICRMVPFYKSRQLVKEKEISNEKLREQVGQIYSQYLQDSGQVDKHNKTVIIPTNACNVNIRDVIGCNKGEKKDQDHEMEN